MTMVDFIPIYSIVLKRKKKWKRDKLCLGEVILRLVGVIRLMFLDNCLLPSLSKEHQFRE